MENFRNCMENSLKPQFPLEAGAIGTKMKC